MTADLVRRRSRPGFAARPVGWLALAGAALAWVAAYELNGPVWDWLLYDAFGMDRGARLAGSLHFFLYDTVKIALLLVGIIFVVTVLRTFMSVERTRALLGGRREGVGNVHGRRARRRHPVLLLLRGAGIHRVRRRRRADRGDAELPDRLAAGQRDRDRPAGHMFGWQIAGLYIAAGLIVAISAGWVLGRLGVASGSSRSCSRPASRGQVIDSTAGLSMADRLQMGREEVRTILRKVWPYLLVGIGLGAVIHGWAPQDFFARYAGAGNPFGVLVAVGIGVPLYSNAAGIMPLVLALHDKGVPMGTLLAFMMSVVALSLPEMILLRRVLKPQLIAAYLAVVATGIIAVGYLFNILLT